MKMKYLFLMLATCLLMCSCADKNETKNTEKTDEIAATTTSAQQTTTLTTTTAETTTTEEEPFVEPDFTMEMSSYDKLKEYLNENFSDYMMFIPEINKEEYEIVECRLDDYRQGMFFVSLKNKETNKIMGFQTKAYKEPQTFEYMLELTTKSAVDMDCREEVDTKNNVIYLTDPWSKEDAYWATSLTDEGIIISWGFGNDLSLDEVKTEYEYAMKHAFL